ncbi:MAG: glycosyltransferase [Candidatus Verstraetearchaeota archaeon]|nr:glycosyltransferase [Candidatus Verstraetearchaeota archaeon]
MEISILFPTKRKYSLELAFYVLSYQTLPKDKFEFIILDNLDREAQAKNLAKETGINTKYVKLNKLGLCYAYNTGFKMAKGELIVSLQDFHWIQPKGLERFLELGEKYPKSCFSAWVINLGPDYIKFDPRVASGFVRDSQDPFIHRIDLFQEIHGQFFEMNFACIPREALEAIADAEGKPWDEEFDRRGAWHWENCALGISLNRHGYKTYLDGKNFCVQIWHEPDSVPYSDRDMIGRQILREKYGLNV